MRLVNLEQFQALPKDTVFMRYQPHYTDDLSIMGSCQDGSTAYCNLVGVSSIDTDHLPLDDTLTLQLEVIKQESFGMDYGAYGRRTEDPDQLFIVYEKQDIEELIDVLTRAKNAL